MPAHFRPASDIADPLPRPVLRAAGQGGALLSEGAVVMLAGAGGAAKSTLASTLALDVAYGGDLVDRQQPGRAGDGLLRPVRRAAGSGDDRQLRRPRRGCELATA